jgi:hypothetical protein
MLSRSLELSTHRSLELSTHRSLELSTHGSLELSTHRSLELSIHGSRLMLTEYFVFVINYELQDVTKSTQGNALMLQKHAHVYIHTLYTFVYRH